MAAVTFTGVSLARACIPARKHRAASGGMAAVQQQQPKKQQLVVVGMESRRPRGVGGGAVTMAGASGRRGEALQTRASVESAAPAAHEKPGKSQVRAYKTAHTSPSHPKNNPKK
jgi:hypothetical protein